MSSADLELIHSLLGDPEVMAHYPRTKTRAECGSWIRRAEDSCRAHGFGLRILENRDGKLLGECGLIRQNIEGGLIEVDYHLHPDSQGFGYATEAALACHDFARNQGIGELISIIDPANDPSRAVALRTGMTYWKDEFVFGSVREIYRIDLSASAVSFAT